MRKESALASGTIGEDVSFQIRTYVDSPWVVADASGKCLEIVLPGQQTRFHTVGRAGRMASRQRGVAAHRSAGRQ